MNQKKYDDFLIEVLTEELPPKTLLMVGESFAELMQNELNKIGLTFQAIVFYATPQRLAVLVSGLLSQQEDQLIERRGPALAAAFDAEGKPTKACIGFAKSLGVTIDQLTTIKNPQGEWVGCKHMVSGKTVAELLPALCEQVLMRLPFKKRMRWGDSDILFERPIHAVIMLYGDHIIDALICGCQTGRVTRGHRFMAPDWITIPHAATYESILKTEGKVIADFMKRREAILQQTKAIVKNGEAFIASEDFLNEVTGLVEWPVALLGEFEKEFLALPKEVLMSEMQDHQRYFPVMDGQESLLPHFVVISNIESHDQARVVAGNERVLRARFADAAFFYEVDKKETVKQRLGRLQDIIFQEGLGTLYEKAIRLSGLTKFIGEIMHVNGDDAARAGLLAKVDLTTQMVGEFPELQGIMGGYYALHEGENAEVAAALKTQYMPRFAKDQLPPQHIGQALSIADKLDTLVGYFGIGQIPTGDKDPFGLRRAALGILRILIEKEIDLDLRVTAEFALKLYQNELKNKQVIDDILNFMHERLRSWYQEQGISADIFAAVLAAESTNAFDISKRIAAVQKFKVLPESQSLSIANKRVSNILAQYGDRVNLQTISESLFEYEEEKNLAAEIVAKEAYTHKLQSTRHYAEILTTLAELKQPIDNFFDHVMVMTDDKARRENRLVMLNKLRRLFLQVADIALLQTQ